jgi:two-component system LytT family response regulator
MTPSLRAVIADDERLARQKLRVLLESEPGIDIVAECQDGKQAVAAIREHRPDVVFLDVRMPHLDGFCVLEKIAGEELPAVVFTTAYDQYAVKAFEANAMDYLLKPFDRHRLHRAVERVRVDLLKSYDRALAGRVIQDLLSHVTRFEATRSEPDDRIMIKTSGRLVFLNVSDIDWIEAAANYVRLHVDGTSYLMREGIGRLASRLDPDRFARIHRCTIVNVGRIRELQPCDSGEYIAVLSNGKELSCSRGYRSQIQRLMGKSGGPG